ncbi:LysM peptidoglycan-binding domain-containing protein [Ornithinibacillus sp. L9]|uniref:LysM peptidoglycan-binding domain-containing protein n=1 Tax=Ornithinibacillus caprae TaxID=2678566 RepID=A0A6N8FH33_9BACI|nr:3D domain-containing protein [Ornithinibacillus caprae]MUK88755.1 LysM peptidoglycan-binding domain-containing protein [Ornithinibacillus caprae]
MKKLVAVLASSVMLASASVMNVSAADYEVEKGDSLWKIAQDYNTTVDNLIDINELDESIIFPKQKLLIYKKYLVQKGDTLYAIAKDHDVSVEDLKKWNELKSDLILIGQELSIKDSVNDNEEQSVATVSTKSQEVDSEEEQEPQGETISVSATAYTAKCDGCTGITYTGVDLNNNPDAKVIAVDPNVIPLGSEVYVEGYGYAIAADIGSAIKGNKIDIHLPTKSEALDWGVRTVDVTIIDKK